MVARTWRGWIEADAVDRYVAYLNETGVPGLSGTDGNRGVYVYTRPDGGRAEVVVVSLWDSRRSIEAFAGEDIERAVFYPEDDEFLVERELTVNHWELLD